MNKVQVIVSIEGEESYWFYDEDIVTAFKGFISQHRLIDPDSISVKINTPPEKHT